MRLEQIAALLPKSAYWTKRDEHTGVPLFIQNTIYEGYVFNESGPIVKLLLVQEKYSERFAYVIGAFAGATPIGGYGLPHEKRPAHSIKKLYDLAEKAYVAQPADYEYHKNMKHKIEERMGFSKGRQKKELAALVLEAYGLI